LKNFVKLIERAHEERFSAAVNRITARKLPVAFLSVELIAPAVESVKNLRAQGLNITNLIVVDDSPPPAGLEFNVVHVSRAAKIFPRPEYVFTDDIFALTFAKNFLADCKIILPAQIRGKDPDEVYEIFMAHLDELREVYESLIDEESKKAFCGYWFSCIANRIDSIIFANAPHYFLEGFTPKAGDIFIDGGCYMGQNAAQFAGLGCKVYSFEMNRTNFNLAVNLAAEKNFVLENLGLGSYKHQARYVDAQGASCLAPGGDHSTTIVTLDDYVLEKKLPRVDCIKLDVEGSELDVLKGAAATITCHKPLLMLSAYHKLDDLWTLMNFVKSLRSDYEFALRQYSTDYATAPHFFDENQKILCENLGVDLRWFFYEETVLFAR